MGNYMSCIYDRQISDRLSCIWIDIDNGICDEPWVQSAQYNVICKTRNAQFMIPKNEDLRNIFLGLHFCILPDLRVVENQDIVLIILRRVYSVFSPRKSLHFFFFLGRGEAKTLQKAYISLFQEGMSPIATLEYAPG